MDLSRKRKRSQEGNTYQNQDLNFCKETNYHNETGYKIITQIQSQNGIRGQLVLFQSSFEPPYTVLHNAADRINAILKVHRTETYK